MTDTHRTPQAYVCGPYSGDPLQVHRNVTRALAIAAWAASDGYLPILPHAMGPHHGMTWEGAMDRCRALVHGLMPGVDVLVTVPGWERSRGALEEVELALMRGVRVIHGEEVA